MTLCFVSLAILIAFIHIPAHPCPSHRLGLCQRRCALMAEYLWTDTLRAPLSRIRSTSVHLLPTLEAVTLPGTSASLIQTFHRHPLFLKL